MRRNPWRQMMIAVAAVCLLAAPCHIFGNEVTTNNTGQTTPPAGLRVQFDGASWINFVPAVVAEMAKQAGISNHSEVVNVNLDPLATGNVDIYASGYHVWTDAGVLSKVELAAQTGLMSNSHFRAYCHAAWLMTDGGMPITTIDDYNKTDLDQLQVRQDQSQQKVEAQVDAMNARFGKQEVFVVPVGDATIKLRKMIVAGTFPGLTNQAQLWNDTMPHPGPHVRALSGYCHFAAFYRISPVGLTNSNFATNARDTVPITAEQHAILQQIAWDVVSPYPYAGIADPSGGGGGGGGGGGDPPPPPPEPVPAQLPGWTATGLAPSDGVVADYNAFIETLPETERLGVNDVKYYTDGQGQWAAAIFVVVDTGSWMYLLIYDSQGNRTSVQTVDTYLVTYRANGAMAGAVPPVQTKMHGVALTLATNSGNLAKTGYAFAGWNTAADGSGASYAAGASYTTEVAVVLYAQWKFMATGGTVTNYTENGTNFTAHIFTDANVATNLVFSGSGEVDVLVVAGGGSGGGARYYPGGGGAGGLIYSNRYSVAAGTYSVRVGAGGAALATNSNAQGNNGGNSWFGSLVAYGGGGGGNWYYVGKDGGSGGGGGGGSTVKAPGSGTNSQGYAGGYGTSTANYGSGGGGGAGSVGGAGTNSYAGHGGAGLYAPAFARWGDTNNPGWFAGGGGASYYSSGTAGQGGKGGGGKAGGTGGTGNYSGQAGQPNTGGGGGGPVSHQATATPGAGGSGIVIVRYATWSDQEAWRRRYFTAAQLADAAVSGDTADPDGDRVPNGEEYAAGTDPTNGASFLGIMQFTAAPAGGGHVVTWQSATGKVYTLQVATNPVAGFTNFMLHVPATPMLNVHTDSTATDGPKFYRVLLEP